MRLNTAEKQELIRVFDENGFKVKDIEEVAFYLEEQGATYLGDKTEIVSQWADLMGVDFPIDFLDHDYIVDNDTDWEALSAMRYINTYRLFEDGSDAIRELELKKELITYK